MKNTAIFLTAVLFSVFSVSPVFAQKNLMKQDFVYQVDEDHTMWTYIAGKGYCQFYNNDDGEAVYHGDVVLSGADIKNQDVGNGRDRAKETLTYNMNGKLHFNEGWLDGPFSAHYTFTNEAYSKESTYRGSRVQRGKLTASYSISGAFKNGNADGSWNVKYTRTENISGGGKSEGYTISASFDDGKLISYKRTKNGETVTIDRHGFITGTIEGNRIRNGLELPSNDPVANELAALMSRGQLDSAIWKGIDAHYHFYDYDRSFYWDILNGTMLSIFNKIGGVRDFEKQLKGRSKYLLHNENGDYGLYQRPIPYYSYNKFVDLVNEELTIARKYNHSVPGIVNSAYKAVNKTHKYSTTRITEGYCFLSCKAADQLKPFVDSLMRDLVFQDISESIVDHIGKQLTRIKSGKQNVGDPVYDTIFNYTGSIIDYNGSMKDVITQDNVTTGRVLIPFIVKRANPQCPDFPEVLKLKMALDIDFSTPLDEIACYPKSPEGTSFRMVSVENVPTIFDTMAPLYNEFKGIVDEISKYKEVSYDLIKRIDIETIINKFSNIEDEYKLHAFLVKNLPELRLFNAALPIDHQAAVLEDKIEKRKGEVPDAMITQITESNIYAGANTVEEMTRLANQLRQYYIDMNSFMDCLDQREPNHKTLSELSKRAKYIFSKYEEYYESVSIVWDPQHSALPELKRLIDRQQRLIAMFNRGDIEELNKKAKKSKLKTIDEILNL